MYLKPLSHQPYGSRTPVYDHLLVENRWVSCCSRRTFLDVLTKFVGRKAVVTSKTKFSTCPFSLRSSYEFLRSQGCCHMNARLLQGSLETPAQLTYDFLRCSCCLTILALSFEGRKSAARTPCSSVHFCLIRPV